MSMNYLITSFVALILGISFGVGLVIGTYDFTKKDNEKQPNQYPIEKIGEKYGLTIYKVNGHHYIKTWNGDIEHLRNCPECTANDVLNEK